MNDTDKKKLYAALAAPFPENCIQRTDGKMTGKGYSTSGIGYQHVVNRLNEVLGIGGFRAHRTIVVKEIARASGRPAFEAICDLTLELGTWEGGQFLVFAESLADGGHVAASEADARKGCFTNAFKKAAAFHGVGRQAYEGTLDDDNVPDGDGDPTHPTLVTHKAGAAPGASTAASVQTPPGYIRTGPAVDTRPAQPERNRLSSKQLAAIWSIARKLGAEQAGFRSQVKNRFGVQLEFVSRQQASELITSLNAQLNGNGSGHHVEDQGVPEAAS